MEVLNFIFKIGVILAVYNFLWWLIMLVIRLLRGSVRKMLWEVYLIKIVRYLFLVDVVFLFLFQQEGGFVEFNNLLIAGLILFMYFLGRIQNKQKQSAMFNFRGNANISGIGDVLKSLKPVFNLRYEIATVAISLSVFIGFFFKPEWANNSISNWFLNNIIGIQEAPVFGFVFKVIGFLFLLNVILKIVNSLLAILSGNALRTNNHLSEEDDDFDDFTEVE